MACLIVIDGPNLGHCFPLGRRTVFIGRDTSCPIQISDDAVSRKHVQIRFDRSHHRYIALDMRSVNGVFINERRMKADAPLRDGDELRIGGTTLIFLRADFPIGEESAIDGWRDIGECEQDAAVTSEFDRAA
jgi:pSer/pThr/pTyr-binding forkhead associated (FHA) protein